MCFPKYLNVSKKSHIKRSSIVRPVLLVYGLTVVAQDRYHAHQLVEERVQTTSEWIYQRKPQMNHTYYFYHLPMINHTSKNVANPLNIKSNYIHFATFEVNPIVKHVYADESIRNLNKRHDDDHSTPCDKTNIS